MGAFIVELENKPGQLARLAEAVAAKGVNLTALCDVAWGSAGAVGLAVSDEAAAREALTAGGFTFREVELVSTTLADQPGSLARAARRLADAGVNIEALAAYGFGEEGRVHLMVGDAFAVRSVLRRAGLSFGEREVLATTLPHRPNRGQAADRRGDEPCSAVGAEFHHPQSARLLGHQPTAVRKHGQAPW